MEVSALNDPRPRYSEADHARIGGRWAHVVRHIAGIAT